ncbi:hypothetical protein HFN86_34460 [Rhizobium laguerreae]|uniref:hypothetical protein n=1 Tax=Rhizobium laguerreae TaxID=1076926 RepID=UPI001C903D93|nr:hypothetical protein [Rhizobium laguerreae]MBY3425240.1 hypothetical protein [Rhizobium laguerreae]
MDIENIDDFNRCLAEVAFSSLRGILPEMVGEAAKAAQTRWLGSKQPPPIYFVDDGAGSGLTYYSSLIIAGSLGLAFENVGFLCIRRSERLGDRFTYVSDEIMYRENDPGMMPMYYERGERKLFAIPDQSLNPTATDVSKARREKSALFEKIDAAISSVLLGTSQMSDAFMGRLHDALISDAPEVWDELEYCHGTGGCVLARHVCDYLAPLLPDLRETSATEAAISSRAYLARRAHSILAVQKELLASMGFFSQYEMEVRKYLQSGGEESRVNLTADSQFADICRSYYAFLDGHCHFNEAR